MRHLIFLVMDRRRVPRGRIRICVRCRWSLNRALVEAFW